MASTSATLNNVKMETASPSRCKYAFVDSAEHRADRILIGALIPVSFDRHSAVRATGGFEVRVCSFEAKYESWFANCMDDLAWVLQDENDRGAYAKACTALLTHQASPRPLRQHFPVSQF